MKLKFLVFALSLWLSLVGFAQNPFPCELSGGEGDPATGGESATQEGQFHDNSAYFNIIEINEPVTLVSAKVFANGPGPRTLAILSTEGDPLTFDVFDLPDGESIVEFNWDLGPAHTASDRYPTTRNSGVMTLIAISISRTPLEITGPLRGPAFKEIMSSTIIISSMMSRWLLRDHL